MRLPLATLALALSSLALASSENEGYYMQPSVRGNTIVFVSQGDLWTVSLNGGLAHAITSHVAPASHPAISPDGKWVAFSGTYEGPGEVYVMPIEGAQPRRLTYEGGMNVTGWTPNGDVLVATSIRSTLPQLQLMRINPNTRAESWVPLWQAADGTYDDAAHTLYFTRLSFQGSHTARYKGGTAQNLWKYADGAGEAVPLTASYLGTSKNPMWWKGRIYFLSDRDGAMNLWSMDENGQGLKQLTHHVGWDIQSASLGDGKIAYQLGPAVWIYDIGSGEDAKVPITLASDFDQTREHWVKDPMEYLSSTMPSHNGAKAVLTARGQVFVAGPDGARLVEVTRKPGVRYRNAIFTPDGKSVLALSDESGETEWWRFPANGVGSGEQITSGSHVLIMRGVVSPDGKYIAYADKDQSLWVCDIAAKSSKKIDYSPDDQFNDLTWSPDSQWLAYQRPTFTFSQIAICSVKTGQTVPVTSDRFDSASPAWSADGKWLYFISDRTFRSVVGSPWGSRQPEPFFDKQAKIYMLGLTKGLHSPFEPFDELYTPSEPKKSDEAKPAVRVDIDFDGLQSRLWEVPVPSDNFASLQANGNRLFVIRRAVGGKPELAFIEIKDHDVAAKTLVDGIDQARLSGDGRKILVSKGGSLYLIPADGPPGGPLEKQVDLSGWSFPLRPQEEWRQMFMEAWRLERDYFYDRKMHSVDWNGVLKRYMPAVDRVRDRDELSNLIGQMVGELSALHTFVYGGDLRSSNDSISPAYLGAVLTRDQAAGGYRVDKIYQADPEYPDRVAPLAKPGCDVHTGDVITQVNGQDTLTSDDISSLLRNKGGKQVLLTIKSQAGLTRQAITKPIGAAQFRDLRYEDWELSRRQQVDSESKGTIGYVHLRAMSSGDMAQWERDFYPVFNRAGLIIDVRHNNGGNIDSWILEKLMRKAWFYWQPRVGNSTWNMQWAFRGHVVVLCDQNTASDGEAFSEGIKRLKLGTVMGMRTWGGEIWLSSSNVLVDGGIATAAETGVYGPEGKWLIEGHGVDPDVVIDNLPHASYLGKDAQLEAALSYLSKEIKDHPVPNPTNPPYPDKSWHPKGS